MSDPEVVVRLLAAIDEREKAAEAASRTGMAFMWARQGGRATLQRHLALSADPDLVLRLCQSHRDIVAEWRKRKQMADQLKAEGDSAATVAGAISAGLYSAVFLLARGYGEGGEVTDFRLISLAEADGPQPEPVHVPRWRRAWCALTGGHRASRVQGLRYGALVTCGRCGWRRARW